MSVFQVTLHGDELQLFLGAQVGGAKVVAIKDVSPKLIGSTELAEQYKIDAKTVRNRLASINKGSNGKFQYDPTEAHLILGQKEKRGTGRKRAN